MFALCCLDTRHIVLIWQSHDFPEITQGQHKNNIQYIIFVVFMELPAWKGAYCPRHVNPLSVRLFNHARGAQVNPGK